MDTFYIFLGVAFIASTAGMPTYSYISRKQYARMRSQFIIQAAFWVVLSAISINALFLSQNTTSTVFNGIFIVIGLLFTSYAISMIQKDKGAYILPFAQNDNHDSFKRYIEELDIEKVVIRTTNGKRYDVIEFTSTPQEQIDQIMNEISTNPEIVIPLNSKEAASRLLKTFTFGAILIALAFIV